MTVSVLSPHAEEYEDVVVVVRQTLQELLLTATAVSAKSIRDANSNFFIIVKF